MMKVVSAKDYGMVSIVMLSHGSDEYIRETVESVLGQTYQNWELIFVADSNKKVQSTILQIRDEMANCLKKVCATWSDYSDSKNRIRISYIYGQDEEAPRRNSAMKEARGKWIAFLDVGDIWDPTKLQRQVTFMVNNDLSFSYTKYCIIDQKSEDCGIIIGGKLILSNQDMMKCCWPGYLTVMYDLTKIGKVYVNYLRSNNLFYAIWLKVSKLSNCYLLEETLAKQRSSRGLLDRLNLANSIKSRYEVYRVEEGLNPLLSWALTIRNIYYGMVNRQRYVERA